MVIKMEIDIKRIRVQITDSTDRVTIYTHMPSPFPPEITKDDLEIDFQVAKGSGTEYVREHFGIEPEVIDTSMRTRCKQLNEKLEKARKNNESENILNVWNYNESILTVKELKKTFNGLLQHKIKIATKNDYCKWLCGFMSGGGEISHVYDYEMNLKSWFVVESDFEISPLYGSYSVNLIVQKGVKLIRGDKGHSNLYFMDDYSTSGEFVPVYIDIKF